MIVNVRVTPEHKIHPVHFITIFCCQGMQHSCFLLSGDAVLSFSRVKIIFININLSWSTLITISDLSTNSQP